MRLRPVDILVVLAHPDDESFAIGGTLAHYAANDACVLLVCATRGDAGIPGMPAAQAGMVRESELRQAVDTLGLCGVDFLDYRDGALASADAMPAIGRLRHIMRSVRPKAVITFGPDGVSGHPDHVTVSDWTTKAFEQAVADGERDWRPRLFYIAPSEATAQGCGVPPQPQEIGGPVVFIDVEPHLQTKARAAQCHASQQPPFAGDSQQAATAMACHEAFWLARPAHLLDPGVIVTDLFAV